MTCRCQKITYPFAQMSLSQFIDISGSHVEHDLEKRDEGCPAGFVFPKYPRLLTD